MPMFNMRGARRPMQPEPAGGVIDTQAGQPQGIFGQAFGGLGRFNERNPMMLAALGRVISGDDPYPVIQAGMAMKKDRRAEQKMAAQENATEALALSMGHPPEVVKAYKAAGRIGDLLKPKEANNYINAGDGNIFNGTTGEWISSPKAAPEAEITGPDGDYVPAPEGQLGPIGNGMDAFGGGNGMDAFGGGAGEDRLAADTKKDNKKPAKPLTEGQSKDTVFATRAAGTLPLIDKYGDALTSLTESVAGGIPLIGNYMKSEGYQQAEQAGEEFLYAVLRKDTGATITDQERDKYGAVYLPAPGDKPGMLAQKKASRARALEAIKAGMPPEALLYMEKALEAERAASPAGGGTKRRTSSGIEYEVVE